MMFPTSKRGVVGSFFEPDEALEAATKVRDSKYTHFDFLTPFPIHGMEEAMGQKPSWIPWVTAVLAFAGIFAAQALMNYVMVYDWPMNFGGKPFWSWPSWVPITFEAMVFFAAIGSAVVAIVAGKRETVPQPPPLLIETGATVDRFVLWISATDPRFDDEEAVAFLESIGAAEVRLVDAEAEPEARAEDDAAGEGDAEAEAEGDAAADGEVAGEADVGDEAESEGDADADAEAAEETAGDGEGDSEAEAEGDADAEAEADAEADADADEAAEEDADEDDDAADKGGDHA